MIIIVIFGLILGFRGLEAAILYLILWYVLAILFFRT